MKTKIFLLALLNFITSCSEVQEKFLPEIVPVVPDNNKQYTGVIDYLTDKGIINIKAVANANHPGNNDPKLIKDISNPNFSYCHPDVEFFPQGFNGYKYWMVFTPYFGAVENNQISKRYENPTIVVSNDGINWSSPDGIRVPLQGAPGINESFREKKGEDIQGFWSDVDWTYENGKFTLYYRVSMVKAKALRERGAKSENNARKLLFNAQRTIVRQTSTDGLSWSPLEAVYTSNPPHSPKNNHVISPTIVYNDEQYVSFEVQNNISPNFPGTDPSYIIRRTSLNGLDFSDFRHSQVINFNTRPWANIDSENGPWHIQATYIDGYYFLSIAAGVVKKYTSELLYLAVSKDGLNFKVLPKPLVEKNAYRSCIFPMGIDGDKIDFGAIIGLKNGVFTYREFHLNKSKLDSWF
ncbi:hypothetical protein [Chryseobacterium indologenes]|uniref:hypothetical protein n=1 Tax=Chryseobacterium indologenes TaxID=253 RepID=UPI0021A36BAF|nr:hypothetical protein [Elizabethkingia anophelis]